MAKPSTTHVIEIETGIGEPAFIPLTVGQELQPISVGKKGMWRIESARVLDVHAFVYFDGTSLFLQSADESASASVDGYRVGKAWTELHAPCKIEIGAARLRFRSLVPDAQAATQALPRAPVQAPPGRAGAPPAPPRPAAGAPPPGDAPVTFPKADRPFKPGEFATGAEKDETTRIAPLDSTGSRPNFGSVVSAAPRPAAGRAIEEDNLTRVVGSEPRLQHTAGMPIVHDPTMGVAPVQAIPQGMQQPSMMSSMPMQPGMQMPMQPGMGMPPGMMGPGGSGAFQQYSGGSGPYNSMGPGPMQSGGYGSMTGGQMPGPPEGSAAHYVAKYKELSPPKRILVILAPFCLIASAYLILFDDAPPPRPTAALDAGADASVASRTSGAPPPPIASPPPITPPVQPVQPACPPGFVPYSIPISPGGLIPCVPAGTPMPAPPDTAARTPPSVQPPVPTPPVPVSPADAGLSPVAFATNNKTLERQAVDAVAVNDYTRAAAIYEQLQQQNPTNRVYAEAARILRAKADAGVP